MKSKRRFYIREWLYNLGTPARKAVQKQYIEDFGCHSQTLYTRLRDKNPSADHILWFADTLGVSLDDLTYPPAQPTLRPLRPTQGQQPLEFSSGRQSVSSKV